MLVTFILSLNSCYDEKMEWNDPYTHPAAKDLPLELQEKISRYEALNAYANFKLGVGIGFDLYMKDEAYRNIVNQNFTDVTAGNEMKQSSLMNGSGVLNFTNVDKVLDELKAAGLTVYGHTLVWHSQQQATYWNSLISPTIIPGTPGSSLIVNGDFEAGLDGWDPPYYKEAVTQSVDFAVDGTHSMRVAVGDWGGDKYNMQINSPKFQIINGHKYEISFFIKSDIEGKVGLDFPNANLTNQYPYTNGAALTTTTSAWTKVTYNPTTTPDGMVAMAYNNAMYFRFLLGTVKDCTYYIDGVEVIDLDAAPEVPDYVNLVAHGTFEEYTAGDTNRGYPDWNSWGASSSGEISADGDGYKGGKCLIIHSVGATANYGVQATTNLTGAFIVGHEYHVEAMMKSSVGNGSVRIQFQGGAEATYLNANPIGTSWIKVEHNFTAANANDKLFFDLGEVSADYYIDDVVVYDVTATAALKSKVLRAGPIVIDKTMEEKVAILEPAFIKYITDVASHFAGKVAAWEVVNEPMNENGTVHTGEENLKATDVFHWQYYFGKDYAVIAFKAARAADPNAKLFINDFGLESANGNKADGLIEYVKYIDANGGHVDGIGTQLHLNLNWSDTTAIGNMFTKLAATGKLIKVTELDIAIDPASSAGKGPGSPVAPTFEQLKKQAEMYEYVARMYTKLIPVAQQYGITVWGVSDEVSQHQYWLPNDVPCLWNANYQRKYAYKGFADGLAGKDVSADFSGELQY